MQCERLIKLIKSWYLNVKDETMAPARMVSFIQQHADECEICLADPSIQSEIKKITEIVLPESKIPKAVRLAQEKEEAPYEDEAEANSEEYSDEGDEDSEDDLNSDIDEGLDDEI